MSFLLTVASFDEVRFRGEAVSVTIPGVLGEMTILAKHEPLVTTMRAGSLTVRTPDGTEENIPVTKGLVEISADGVTVLL